MGQSDPVQWQAAAEAWLALRRPCPAAYAQWRQAEALLASGAPRAKVEEPLRAAHAVAVRLGRSYVSGRCLMALLSREDGVLSYRPLCLHHSWVERSTSGFAGCRSVGRREAYRLLRANE